MFASYSKVLRTITISHILSLYSLSIGDSRRVRVPRGDHQCVLPVVQDGRASEKGRLAVDRKDAKARPTPCLLTLCVHIPTCSVPPADDPIFATHGTAISIRSRVVHNRSNEGALGPCASVANWAILAVVFIVFICLDRIPTTGSTVACCCGQTSVERGGLLVN